MTKKNNLNQESDGRTRKLILWLIVLFALLFAAIAAVGIGYYLNEVNRIKTQKQNELMAVAELKVKEISEWRDERVNDGLIIQGNSLIGQSVQTFLLDPQNVALKQQNIQWLSNIRSVFSYSTFFLVAKNGEMLIQDATHSESLGEDEISFARQAAESSQVMLSDLHFLPDGKTIRIDLFIPVLDSSKRTIATIVFPIDPYLYLYPLIQSWPVPSQSAETLLVESKGNEIVFLSPLRFIANSALNQRAPLSSPDLPAARALRGELGPFEGMDYRNIPVVAVGARVQGTDWIMISKEDSSEIYSEVRRQGWIVAVVLGLILILDLTFAYYLIRRQRLILVNKILQGQIEQQRLEQRYDLLFENSNDILFVIDDADKITALNDRAIQAYGYTRKELIDKDINIIRSESVRPRIKQKMVEAKENDGARFESIHQKKDGALFPVELSVRYFQLDQKNFFLLIVRDISEQKNKEDQIRASEARYRGLTEHASDGIFLADSKGQLLDVNEQGCHMVGYLREEILKLGLGDLVEPESITKKPLRLRDLTSHSGKVLVSERNLIRKDGSQFPVEVIAYSLPDGNIQGMVRDITDQVKHRKELEAAAEKYLQLFNSNPVPLYVYDSNTLKFLAVNNAALRLYGYPRKEFLNLKVFAIKNEQILPADLKNQQSRGKYNVWPEKQIKKNGEIIDVEITSNSIEFNDRPARLEIAVDVTEKLRIENELKENLNALESLINTSPLGIVTTDMDGNVTLWSKEAEEIFGWKAEELLGKLYPLLPESSTDTVQTIIQRNSSLNESTHYEAERKRKDGNLIIVDIKAASIRDYRDQVKGMLALFSDVTEIKEIELANKRISEERDQLFHRLNLQFERLPIGFILTDENLNILDWNPQAEKIFGYTREEMIGKSQYDTIIPKEAISAVKRAIKKATTENKTIVTQNENITKDGNRITVEWHNTSLLDESGHLIALMDMAIDVTERVNAERRIRESEEKLRTIFESNLVGIYFADVSGMIISANDELLNILGYTRTELESGLIRLEEITPEEFLPLDRVAIGQAQNTGVCTPYEKQFICKDGTLIWVLVGFAMMGKGTEFTSGFVLDISERKQAENEIQSKQKLLDMTGQIGKIGGWEIDVTNNTSTWTEEVARIHDLDPKTPASVQLSLNFYSPESRPIIENAVNEILQHGKPYDLELEIISAKGVHKLIRTAAQPQIVDEKVVWVRGIMQDITELKKAEAEIRKLNDELEQRVEERTAELLEANKELESFSYSVSHDLRAPLRAIDGFSQIIMDDFPENVSPEIIRYLGIIRMSTKNMGNLVDDLLAFSRLGRQSVQRQSVNIKKLVEEVVEEINFSLEDRNIEFTILDLPDCEADINLLRQVFINLISNAVKFTRKCSSAQIEIGSEPANPPRETKLEKYSKNCYYVKDNGVGFDMRYYDKLFGVFQRLHKSEDYEGTGVGLAIVKRVIEKHGGMVWAESKLNQGTVFKFVLGEKDENDQSN